MAAVRPPHRRCTRLPRMLRLVLVTGALTLVPAMSAATAAPEAAGSPPEVHNALERWDDELDLDFDPVPDPAAGPDEPVAVCPRITIASPFGDVPASNQHVGSIACIAQLGIAPTDLDGGFRPGSPIRRDELATFLTRALTTSGHQLPIAATAFTDIAGAPGEEAIAQLAAAGIVHGRTPTTYEPEGQVTRAQMASYLVRTVEWVQGTSLNAPGASPFTDIAGTTHERAIDAAYALELTVGRTATSYDPDAPVRRDQAATFMLGLVELLDR